MPFCFGGIEEREVAGEGECERDGLATGAGVDARERDSCGCR